MSHIKKFRKNFKIDQKADLQNILPAVEAIYEANRIATEYLGEIEPLDEKSGFRTLSIINLLGRVFEHTEGMLVAMSTGSPASAEALARIVVEGSINVMYLATIGNSSTLIHFFRSWLTEHERKLTEWKQAIQSKEYVGQVSAMIDERSSLVSNLVNFVNLIEHQYSIEPPEKNNEWPKSLFKRFEAMGRETDYYESYHRLSGASHLTGEDTLIWLLALESSTEQKINIAKEAWAYALMMTRIACIFFIDAAAACVIGHGRSSNEDLQKYRQRLMQSVQSIAKEAGVPQGK